MSSQNVFLEKRRKGKENFPDTVPWREGLVWWAKVGVFVAVGSVWASNHNMLEV
jgi:hypothetical protein